MKLYHNYVIYRFDGKDFHYVQPYACSGNAMCQAKRLTKETKQKHIVFEQELKEIGHTEYHESIEAVEVWEKDHDPNQKTESP